MALPGCAEKVILEPSEVDQSHTECGIVLLSVIDSGMGRTVGYPGCA